MKTVGARTFVLERSLLRPLLGQPIFRSEPMLRGGTIEDENML